MMKWTGDERAPVTRPCKSLHTLSAWLGGDALDLAWSAATVAVVLAAVWAGLIHH